VSLLETESRDERDMVGRFGLGWERRRVRYFWCGVRLGDESFRMEEIIELLRSAI